MCDAYKGEALIRGEHWAKKKTAGQAWVKRKYKRPAPGLAEEP